MDFQAFDSVEAMFAEIGKREERLNASVIPIQRAVTYGSYWLRVWEDIPIFGYVFTRDELEASERNLGSEGEELAMTMERMDSSYQRGYRFGRAYSVIEPDGELGDTHIASMAGPLTPSEFRIAQDGRWSQDEPEVLNVISRALVRFAASTPEGREGLRRLAEEMRQEEG